MTLSKEYSIAADSTLSISPLPVKRATRTYGRPKDTRVDPADSSITDPACSSTSRQSLYRTAPPNLEEEVPPSSDVQLSLDDDDEEGKTDDAHLKFSYGWKRKLWEIDHAEDHEGTQNPVLPANSPSGNAPAQSESKEFDAPSSPQRETDSVHASPRGVEPLPDVFGGSLPTASSSQSSLIISPAQAPRVRNRVKRPSTVVHDSDSDEGKIRSSPTSPAFPHPINTPQSRSSPTPPTSEAEVDTNIVPRSKRKGKARDVEPMTPATGKDKHGKIKPRERKAFKEKAPTKKSLRESTRAHFHVPAVQHVSIPRPEEQKYTIRNFFSSLSLPSSDPIESFSSPQVLVVTESEPESRETLADPAVVSSDVPQTFDLKPQASDLPEPVVGSDSDGDLPEVGELLKEQEQKRSEAERAKALAEMKRRALAERAARSEMGDIEDSDDDLEIVDDMRVVAEEETGQRKAMRSKHARLSEGRKRQLLHGKVPVGHGHHTIRKRRDPLEQLKVMAKTSFEPSSRDRHGKRTQEKDGLNPGGLNRILWKKIDEDNVKNIRKKEEEWVRRGGQLLHQVEVGSKALEGAFMTYAEKGLKATEANEMLEEDTADESDQDWTPETRGSASPPCDEIDGEAPSEASDGELNTNGDKGMDAADEDIGGDKIACPRIPRHAVGYLRAVIDSDEDDSEENAQTFRSTGSFGRVLVPDSSFVEDGMPPPRQLPIIVHRRSSSSLEDRTEDETDKENNTRLMYDKSEDKENKAVVRHSPLVVHGGAHGGSLESLKRSSSISTGAEISGDENEPIDEGRAPFKELLEHEGDPFVSQPLRTNISFTARLQQISPVATQTTVAPKSLSFDAGDSGFSQFLDGDENSGNSPFVLEVPKLQGLSQPFEFGTEGGCSTLTPTKINQPALSHSPTKNMSSMLDHLRKPSDPDDLSLSLDVRLQPALEVNENFRRQADSIFEKEQEYLLEAARRKPNQTAELYVNDHGFLTQTRPDVSTPEIYRFPSPSQTAKFSASQSRQEGISTSQLTQRRPLRTLSLTQDLVTPSRAPLMRLRRRSTSPLVEHGYRSSPSPSPQKRVLNAFDVLARNARANDKAEITKKKLGKSEFVETEAQESDEDERLGFGVFKKTEGDEEGEGEDLDKNLAELVDDAHMDTETHAADLVLEKVKEHQEEDDRALEKYHRDAAEGKHRVKRRGRGLDMDESDEEDEEDEVAGRIRRQIHKKRKIEGDNLEALGQNEATRAFYETYQRDLIDDGMDFDVIPLEDIAMSDEEEENREAVSVTEICERAREMARTNKTYDPSVNASWQSQDSEDDDDDHVRIKEVLPASRKRPVGARTTSDQMDFDGIFERPKQINETEPEKARLLTWAKGEKGLRNRGITHSVAGASSSVTGHGKPRVKAGGGSVRTAQHVPTAVGSDSTAHLNDQRKLGKTASVLAGISDRTPRFENC